MTREELAAALRKADAAGNADDARRLAGAIRQMDAGASAQPANGSGMGPVNPMVAEGRAMATAAATAAQSDPALSPLMPGARTLTAGQPTRLKPPPAPRGPLMSPMQRNAMAPERAAAEAERKAAQERREASRAYGGGMDMVITTDAQGQMRPGTEIDRDLGAGITTLPVRAVNAASNTAQSVLNLPGDLAQSAMGGERVIPRADIPEIPLPQELQSVSGDLSQNIMQFLMARGAIGKAMPGGGMAAQAGKDALALGAGFDSDTPRLSDTLAAEFMRENGMGWMADRDPNNPMMERVKNGIEEMFLAYAPVEAVRRTPQVVDAITGVRPATMAPTNAGGARLAPPVPRLAPPAPGALAQPQQQASAPPPGGAPPQGPAATPQPPQAPQPASAVSSLGEAEVWYNALPQKTREAILRTMSSSGVRDKADQFAIIADLNSLPPGRNSQNAFLISQKWGERYPSLRENLLNMGGEFSASNPRANDQKVLGVFGKGREDRAQALMDTEGRKQVVSERGFLERSAETNFGAPSAEVEQQMRDELLGLGKTYNKLLDPQRQRRFGPEKSAMLAQADQNLVGYLKQPHVAETMPEWVKMKILTEASEEMRRLKFSDADKAIILAGDGAVLAPLFSRTAPLQWSPELWSHLVEQYPKVAGHFLQSAYGKAIGDAAGSLSPEMKAVIPSLQRARGFSSAEGGQGEGLLYLLEETMPNSQFSTGGAGSYQDTRLNYGDIKGAEEALEITGRFKSAAQNGQDVAEIVRQMGGLSPRGKEAALSQITSFVQDSMGAKVRNIAPGQVGMAAETAPNLTQLGNDNFLAALRKVFGDQGDALANDIELARSSTTFNTDMNRRIGPNTQLKQENVRNAPRTYENPAGLEGNVFDSTFQTLGSAGLGAAFFPGGQGTAVLLGSLAAAKGAWNAYKKGKRLNNTERSLLADFFFRSREAGVDGEALLARADDAPPRSPNLPSPIGYAGNVAVGAGAGGVVGGMAGDGDPNAIMGGVLAGAAGGGARAGQRAAKAKSSIIKPRPMPRNAPGSGPSRGRPLPGQTSPASPTATGIVVGGIGGAMADQENPLRGAAIGAGVLGAAGAGVGNRLAKGSSPKPPKGPPAKPPPVKNGFGGKSLPMDEPSRMQRAREQGFDVDNRVYHGSSKSGGFDEFQTSERGRFGPGVYFSEQPGVAGKYGEAKPYVVPTNDQLFDAMPSWNSLSDDAEQRIIKQLKPNEREKLAALKNWYKREGEAFWEALRRSVDGDDKILADARASEVIQAAGFKGIRGIGDGQETVIFNPKNVRSPDAKFDPSETQSSKLLAGVSGPRASGVVDNLKQDVALAGFGSVGGSFANQDDPQAGALGGMGIALGAKYGGRSARAIGNRLGGAPKPPPAGKFRGPNSQTFAGVNAKTADKAALARAQNMEAEGASRDDIWDATGWFKGVDGKWRFEIDDSRSVFNEIGNGRDYLTHPGGMFKAYRDVPGMQDLGDVRVMRSGRPDEGAFMGSGSPIESLHIGKGSSDPRSIALHEYQHGIQAREGFAKGGSPSDDTLAADLSAARYDDLVKKSNAIMAQPNVVAAQKRFNELKAKWQNRSDIPADIVDELKSIQNMPEKKELARLRADANKLLNDSQTWGSKLYSKEDLFDGYKRLAGETESRNVQTRRDFTPEQRRARRPWETQDVPDDQQIVRFGGGKAESRPKGPPTGNRLGKPKPPPKGPPKPKPVEARRTAPRGNNPFRDPRLTPGENKTAEMVLNGYSYDEIADEMMTSRDVVKTQASAAQRKLGADVKLPLPGMGKRPAGSTRKEAAFELFDSGVGNAQIAERLGISVGNVRTYRSYWKQRQSAPVASVEGAMYNPPSMPERPFEADYPQSKWPDGPPVDAQGRLTRDMDGNPLDQTSAIIGRNKAPGYGPKSEADRSLRDRIAVIQTLKKAGSSLERVPRSPNKANGSWAPTFDANGRLTGRGSVQIADDLDRPIVGLDDQEVTTLSHELAHSIDFKGGPAALRARNPNTYNNREWGIDHKNPHRSPEARAKLESQLERIYTDLNNPVGGEVKIRTPQDHGYEAIDADRELWAEAIRAYMYDPNYIKTVAPEVAFAIRDHVNGNKSLRKTIQFNAAPTIVGLGGLGLGAAALSAQPAEAQKR
jgi:DNA-binding CsgD family transcriptional regulator